MKTLNKFNCSAAHSSRLAFTKNASWLSQYRVVDAIKGGTDLFSAFAEWDQFRLQLVNNLGTVGAIKVLKDLNSLTKLVAIGQRGLKPVVTLGGKWYTLNSSGLPKVLPHLTKVLKSGRAWECVNITNQVLSLKTKPSHIIETITAKRKSTDEDYNFFMSNFRQTWKWSSPQLRPAGWKAHMSLKAGPNGPSALLSSTADAVALAMSPGLLGYWQALCRAVGMHDLVDRLDSHLNWISRSSYKLDRIPMLAKLAFLADKAGKTRVVYILNYWMQSSLLPLHNVLMEELRKRPEDGTYRQQVACDTVKSWTKEGKALWSFDLTAATDRWPKEHQMYVLQQAVGQDWASLWSFVMSVKPMADGQLVEYGVGQPMGAYASWAAFALTHHETLSWLASRIGIAGRPWVILGDDLVIADKALALEYKEALRCLGVDISYSKSVTPERQRSGSSAEFAKHIYLDGVDLTPLSPMDTRDFFRTPWGAMKILNAVGGKDVQVVKDFGGDHLWVPTPVSDLLDLLDDKARKKVTILLAVQGKIPASYEGEETLNLDGYVKIDNPWKGVDNITYLQNLLDLVVENLQRVAGKLTELTNKLLGRASGTVLPGHCLESPAHPIKGALDTLDETLKSYYRTIADGVAPKDFTDTVTDSEYLDALLVKGLKHRNWKTRKDLRAKVLSSLTLKTYQLSTSKAPDQSSYEDW